MPGRATPERFIELLLANPLSVAPQQLDAAAAEIASRTLTEAERWKLPGDEPSAAHGGLLAYLHARALRGGNQVTAASHELKRLTHYPEFERVAHASARCTRRLRQVQGTSAALERVRRQVWAACLGQTLWHGVLLERLIRSQDVLITGETGVGKEALAHAIGEGTPGRKGSGPAAFAELNAAAVPDTLVESELFGYAKGAFTGATTSRAGLIRSADGGAMFFDEVGDLPASTQAKLLRVIETDRVQPLGTEQVHEVDVRFISATHHDLSARVQQGTFRADLYQRLAAVVIHVPPLRQRPEDIAPIGEQFIAEATRGAPWPLDTRAISRWLQAPAARDHSWPGNARELRNVVGNLLLGLPVDLATGAPLTAAEAESVPEVFVQGQASLATLERWYLARVLTRSRGNVASAARVLGIDRTTVIRKIKQLKLRGN